MDRIEFDVNGKRVGVAVDPDTPLLYVLRNDLGLKGTRAGCVEGQCMSCTVLIDGRAVTACMEPVSAVAGRKVETVESLVDGGTRHPLVESFIKEQAGQCGYCLAGILMRAKALMAAKPSPTRDDIETALDGHLCRCGAHARMIRAIEQAASVGRVAP
jgi:aerobic-type carbon monoxide dehydrogenase small subunit (CoxS/CutS family)